MKKPFTKILNIIKEQKTEKHLVGSIIVASTILLSTVISLNTCFSVTVDGEHIGYTATASTLTNVLETLKEETAVTTGLELSDTYNTVESEVAHVLFGKKLSSDELAEELDKNVEWLAQGAVLNINNGETQFVLKNQAEAQKIIDTLYAENTTTDENSIVKSVGLLEDVRIEDTNVRISQLTTAEDALATIREGKEAIKIHTVVSGDSLWAIARSNGLTVDELKALNPQLESEKLKLEQQLTLTKLEPLLNVVVTKEVTTEETIAHETEYKDNSSLLRGESKVITAGKDGSKVVTYEIKESNGIALEKEVLNEVVLSEPVTAVVSKGTGAITISSSRSVSASSGSGSGSLSWPKSGKINSPYGSRSRGFHTGIDISAKTGDPVYAAAGGTVVSAGWAGGYGYCVVLDHGNGLKTRYAHLSSLSVSSGQTVSRGGQVGKAGSTGNSTGPHLHFEVIVNGSTVNPMNYLN